MISAVMTHLVATSGELGFSAVLPPAERLFPGQPVVASARKVPHLPLSRKYDTDSPKRQGPSRSPAFSLSDVASLTNWHGHSMRNFAARLLMRYSYVLGHSRTEFVQLGIGNYEVKLGTIAREKQVALLCINDDLENHATSGVPAILRQWLAETFPGRLAPTSFERTVQPKKPSMLTLS